MVTSRAHLRRVVWWMAAAVMLLAGYAASLPFVIHFVNGSRIGTSPTIQAVARTYSFPLLYYMLESELPGSDLHHEYFSWCRRQFHGNAL